MFLLLFFFQPVLSRCKIMGKGIFGALVHHVNIAVIKFGH